MTKRIKRAAESVPQTLDEASALLGAIGALQREVEAIAGKTEAIIADVKQGAALLVKPLSQEIDVKVKALQAYAEANRAELTFERKSVVCATGAFGWRWSPPAVKVEAEMEETVIAELRRRRLADFLRETVTINKLAILEDPARVAKVPFVSVQSTELFWAKPLEVAGELERKTRHVRAVGAAEEAAP